MQHKRAVNSDLNIVVKTWWLLHLLSLLLENTLFWLIRSIRVCRMNIKSYIFIQIMLYFMLFKFNELLVDALCHETNSCLCNVT